MGRWAWHLWAQGTLLLLLAGAGRSAPCWAPFGWGSCCGYRCRTAAAPKGHPTGRMLLAHTLARPLVTLPCLSQHSQGWSWPVPELGTAAIS